jgi:hypothetical protein
MNLPNKAPSPNRRPRFPLGGLGEFEYHVCAPPASLAAVGEARRWAEHAWLHGTGGRA